MLTHIAECTSWIVLSKTGSGGNPGQTGPSTSPKQKHNQAQVAQATRSQTESNVPGVCVCALPFNKVRYDPFTGRHLLDNRHGMHTEPLLDLQCPRGRERVNDLQANPIPREARPFPSSIDCHLH
jgi:hypothetical protein